MTGGVPEKEGFGGDPPGGEGAAQGEDGVGEEEGLLQRDGGEVAVEGGDAVEGKREGGRLCVGKFGLSWVDIKAALPSLPPSLPPFFVLTGP